MKSPCLLVALAIASYMTCLCVCYDDAPPAVPPHLDVKKLAKAISLFSMDLHTVLGETRQTFVFSPVSIHLALSMAIIGAKGTTATELTTALEVHKFRNFHEQYKGWLGTTTNNCKIGKDCDMQLNNTYLINKAVTLEQKFVREADLNYPPSVVDLKAKTVWSFTSIWFSKFKGPHKDITRGIPYLAMVVNVIQLRLPWKRRFIYNKGSYMAFTTPTFETVMTTSMRVRGRFGYALSTELNCLVLKIPFENDRFGFYILVPTKPDGLAGMEAKLARRSVHLDPEFRSVRMQEFILELPLFAALDVIDLAEPLKKLGINHAFVDKADFTKMTPVKLKFGHALHTGMLSVGLTHLTIGPGRLFNETVVAKTATTHGLLDPSGEAEAATSNPMTTLSENVEDGVGPIEKRSKDVVSPAAPKKGSPEKFVSPATPKKGSPENVVSPATPKKGSPENDTGHVTKKADVVKVDYPFLFFVRDDLYDVLLIQGRLLKPSRKPETLLNPNDTPSKLEPAIRG